MSAIPVHGLPPQLSVPFALMRLAYSAEARLPAASVVHRHTRYGFLLYESGTATAMVDLQTLTFGAGDVYYLLPGQVHQRLREHQLQGWFLEVDAGLIPPSSVTCWWWPARDEGVDSGRGGAFCRGVRAAAP